MGGKKDAMADRYGLDAMRARSVSVSMLPRRSQAMASHGRRGVAALLLGSETTKVLTHSKIPVLVYR